MKAWWHELVGGACFLVVLFKFGNLLFDGNFARVVVDGVHLLFIAAPLVKTGRGRCASGEQADSDDAHHRAPMC